MSSDCISLTDREVNMFFDFKKLDKEWLDASFVYIDSINTVVNIFTMLAKGVRMS